MYLLQEIIINYHNYHKSIKYIHICISSYILTVLNKTASCIYICTGTNRLIYKCYMYVCTYLGRISFSGTTVVMKLLV